MTWKAVGIETGKLYATGSHAECSRAVNERVSNIDGRQNERIEHGNPERVLLNSLLGCYWLSKL